MLDKYEGPPPFNLNPSERARMPLIRQTENKRLMWCDFIDWLLWAFFCRAPLTSGIGTPRDALLLLSLLWWVLLLLGDANRLFSVTTPHCPKGFNLNCATYVLLLTDHTWMKTLVYTQHTLRTPRVISCTSLCQNESIRTYLLLITFPPPPHITILLLVVLVWLSMPSDTAV